MDKEEAMREVRDSIKELKMKMKDDKETTLNELREEHSICMEKIEKGKMASVRSEARLHELHKILERYQLAMKKDDNKDAAQEYRVSHHILFLQLALKE